MTPICKARERCYATFHICGTCYDKIAPKVWAALSQRGHKEDSTDHVIITKTIACAEKP
jgi:hypothetical protein